MEVSQHPGPVLAEHVHGDVAGLEGEVRAYRLDGTGVTQDPLDTVPARA